MSFHLWDWHVCSLFETGVQDGSKASFTPRQIKTISFLAMSVLPLYVLRSEPLFEQGQETIGMVKVPWPDAVITTKHWAIS
jgi:hypothetical protein